MRVVLTSKGFKGSGRYIGRSKNLRLGIFGNPFPTKPSKFSKRIYTLEESLFLYRKWVEEQLRSNPIFKEEFQKLIKSLKEKGEVILDCWCADCVIETPNHIPSKCHGEVLALLLLKAVKDIL